MGLGACRGEPGGEEEELGWELYVGREGDGDSECRYWVEEAVGG